MGCVRHIDVLAVAERGKLARQEPRAPAVRERLRRDALELARREALIEAAYSYRIVPLEQQADEVLRAEGEAFHAPWLVPKSGRLTALGCAVCTVGGRLERRVNELIAERRASLALVLDQLGNELLYEVSRRVQDRMLTETRRARLSMAGELRPGDPGLDIDAQTGLLRLAKATDIGVSLSEGMLMRPHKSTSMLLGVGIDLPPATWSRCESCRSRAKCRHAALDATV